MTAPRRTVLLAAATILRSVGVLVGRSCSRPATFVYVFLFKMMSFMQSRLGPMEAGPFGSLQLLAEVGKFLQKEDIAPAAPTAASSSLAPYIVVWPRRSCSSRRCRSGPTPCFTDLDIGDLLRAARCRLSVSASRHADRRLGSANKYSADRVACARPAS